HDPRRSLTTAATMPVTSDDTSLSFGWFENFGSGCLMLTMAVSPSDRSAPDNPCLMSLSRLAAVAYALIVRVSAWRKPVRCVPPSLFLMLLVKQKMFSENESLYWIAISASIPSLVSLKWIGLSCTTTFDLFRSSTNEATPPTNLNSSLRDLRSSTMVI